MYKNHGNYRSTHLTFAQNENDKRWKEKEHTASQSYY